MEQKIVVGDKEFTIRFDAYFPIFYREVLNGADFFADEARCSQGDTYKALYIMYAAVRYGDKSYDGTMEEFLSQFDMASALDGAVSAVTFMRSTYQQTAQSKKK